MTHIISEYLHCVYLLLKFKLHFMKHFGLIPNQHQYFGLYIRIVPIYIIKFRSSVVSNADLYNFYFIVYWCCERLFRECVEKSRIYSWYLSAGSTLLQIHNTPWGTTTVWGFISYHLQQLCFVVKRNFQIEKSEGKCLRFYESDMDV